MTIRVEDLEYTKGNFHLNCGTLDMEDGKVTCIIGKNGSGKSTLLKLINGSLKANSGRTLLDGRTLESFTPRELSRKISFVQQEMTDPMGFSVREVMSVSAYSRDASENDMRTALGLFEVGHLVNRKFSDLSGGERRLVTLSASIYQNSETIIMDEPTTFLDVDKQLLVNDVIRKLKENGKTVIIVMHDLSAVYSIADNIVLMKGGEVVASGETSAIMSADNLERAFDVEFEIFETPAGKEFKGRRQIVSQH